MAPIVYYLNKSYLRNLRGKTTTTTAANIAADIDIVSDYKKATNGLHELSFVGGRGPGISTSSPAKPTTTAGAAAPSATSHHSSQLRRLRSNNSDNCCPLANKPFYWLRTLPGQVLLACIVLGSIASFYNVYSKDLPPSWLYTMPDPDGRAIYFDEHLLRLFTHLAVFSMGLLAGLECRRAARLAKANDAYRRATTASSSAGPLGSSATSNGGSTTTMTTATTDTSAPNTIAYPLNNNHPGGYNYDREACMVVGGSSATNKSSNKLAIILESIGSIAIITIMTAILFSTYDWSVRDLPGPLVSALYDVSSRLLWSLSLIWILYKVSVPKELASWPAAGQDESANSNSSDNNDSSSSNSSLRFSLLARILGRPGMVSLGKLSFLIYILHPFVHTTVLAIQEQPIYSSWFMLFHVMLGNFALTTILASLVSVFVEMPFRNLFVRHCGSSLFLAHAIVGQAGTGAHPGAGAASAAAASVPVSVNVASNQ